MRRTALSVVALLSFAGTAFAQQAYEGSWAGTKEDCSDPRMWVLSIESNEFWNFEAYCKIGRATKSGNQWKLSSKCSDNEGNWDDITIPLSILTNDRLIFNDSILVRCEHGPAKASTHRNAAAESSSGSAARPSAALMASDLLTRAVKCTRETRPSEVLKQLITMGAIEPRPFAAPSNVNYFRTKIPITIGPMNILAVLAHERDGFEYVRDPRLPRNIARLIDVGRLIGFSTDTSLLKIDYWRKDADLDREKIELDDSAAFKGRVKDVICWPAGNPRYRH